MGALAGNLVLTDDLVLNTVFAGFGIGISLGITIRAGASTGGMDIPPLVLNKWFHLPVSATMMVFDLIILAVQAAFSPLQQCLYGIVMVIVYTVVLDKVLIFGSTRTEVKIISQHADEIREAIFSQLDRGVTILHGEGGYSRNSEQEQHTCQHSRRILAAQAAFSPVRQSLYGVVMAIIYTVVLDKVLMLGTTRTEVKIISAKSDEICAAIFAQLDRGVTILHGEGGYLREPESVLLSVVSNRQLPRLEKLAHTIDPTCFMIVSHVTEVSGRGFSLEKDYQVEE